jgi:glycosyltransferase involved in cell wall biosynthesis
MPYFLRHYQSFADAVIIYDDASDDGTQDIVQSAGAQLRQCPWSGLDDVYAVTFANQQYREARGVADWVIWVDGDEFLYHNDIKGHLQALRASSVTLPVVQGYCMFAAGAPVGNGQIYEEYRSGVPDERYSKPVILNPSIEMQWGPGKHEFISPGLRECEQPDPLKLLHYRWFGRELYMQRNQKNVSTLAERNRAYGLGQEVYSPSYRGHHSLEWYESHRAEAVDVIGIKATD